MKIRKPTAEEFAKDIKFRVYPLHGYVRHRSGMELEVEFVGDTENQIKYKVISPDGYHFYPDGLHTLLCSNQKDVFSRINQDLVQCGEDC